MQGHVSDKRKKRHENVYHPSSMLVSPDQVPLVSEASVALRALVGLLLGSRRHIGGVMVEVLMPLEQLLLPEALVTLITLIRLLVSVDQHVALKLTLRDGAVGAQVTLEALFSLVGLLVHFQGVPVNYPQIYFACT